jgi:hypothetical protein
MTSNGLPACSLMVTSEALWKGTALLIRHLHSALHLLCNPRLGLSFSFTLHEMEGLDPMLLDLPNYTFSLWLAESRSM